MINIREDGILEIEETGLFEDDKDVLFNSYEINLNSIYMLSIYSMNRITLVANNDKIICNLPAEYHDELISKLKESKLYQNVYVNYDANTYYIKEESKDKQKEELTQEDFNKKVTTVDLFVKLNSPEVFSVIETPGFKTDSDETFIPNKVTINLNNGDLVIYEKEEK